MEASREGEGKEVEEERKAYSARLGRQCDDARLSLPWAHSRNLPPAGAQRLSLSWRSDHSVSPSVHFDLLQWLQNFDSIARPLNEVEYVEALVSDIL